MSNTVHSLARIWTLVKQEKAEVFSIYFYAILNGLIQLSLPLGIQAIIGFVMGSAISTSLILLIVLVVLGVLFNGMLQIGQMKIIESVQQKLFVRFAFEFAHHIPKLDLKKVDSYYLPELVNRFFEIPNLQKSLSKLLLDLPAATIQIIFGVLLLSFYHPFFIFFGALLVFLLVLILYVTGNKGLQTSLAESTYKYAVAGWLEEMARVVKSFKFTQNTNLALHRTDDKVTRYLEARKSHFSILLLQYRSLVGFKVIITAAMLVIGCLLLLNQQINIGQFIAAEIIIITIINSVEKIIINLDSVYDVMTSVEKINKLTEKPVEENGSYVLDEEEEVTIELKGVSFGYSEEEKILKSLSAKIAGGQKVCITGNDGAGKTSLLKLLTGVYKDFDGAVLINEVPIGNYNLQSLRGSTGIKLSHQDIFHGTLWENIVVGNDSADRRYIIQLIQKTGLQHFISTLKNGFDTELDPTGKRLPQNVVQKLLLVRALAGKPKLLLLDEPFINLEEQTKTSIQNLLLNELNGVTVIVASNDAAFAKKCDTIIHLGEGMATIV